MNRNLDCVKKESTETFCHSILRLLVGKSKALSNLVMALASNDNSSSVTDLCRSSCYHYQYSSICDSINGLYSSSGTNLNPSEYHPGRELLEKELLRLKSDYFADQFDDTFYLLNTDSTPLIRPHSPTLADRSYVYVPNERVKGNRPVDVGYEYSVIGLSARRPLYGAVEPAWNLPLSTRRVPTGVNKGSFAAQQVSDLLENPDTPLHNQLVVNALDRLYGTPEYVVGTHDQAQLVNVIRLKNNRNVWRQLSPQQVEERRQNNADQRGANAVFGEKHQLRKANQWEIPADEEIEFGVQLGNGKQVLVRMQEYKNMLIRSKRGNSMKKKPFRLISVQLIDPLTDEPLFKRRMWLAVWGERQMELSLEQSYWVYRNRFDIEHYFRFGKQRLLMDDYQTPEVEHQDNWMEIVGLAYWLLWAARPEAVPCVYKWQKYDPYYKNRVENRLPPTPSEVQRQLKRIILTFEQTPFYPKLQIKGKGREKGQTQPKRKRHKVVYKGKKRVKERA